jgi:TolB-like protein
MGEEKDRLDSWKEIAAYLNRSVRTVRRWEAEEALPVHRHMHRSLGSVYAYRSELEAWRQASSRSGAQRPVPVQVHAAGVASIAVLPFTNLSPESADDYFADGLTDEVIVDLSRIRALRVISRTSSMTLRGTSKDIRTIGRELSVRFLVEGTVRRQGNRLRITARLIDAETDDHLWSDRYEGTLEDVFGIQERIARTIVEALSVELTTDEDRRLGERRIGDPHAWECYLQARQEALRWRPDSIDRAVQLLQNGLSIVGEDASLYAALGRVHLQYREAGIDWSERPLLEAEACAKKVFELAPGSAAAVLLRGWISYSRSDVQNAVRDLEAVLEIEPSNPDGLGLLANCYLISGRVPAARPLIERLLAVDPLTPLTRCLPGWADVLEGRLAEAIGPYRRMFEMDPGNPMGRLFYAWVLALNRRRGELRELAEQIPVDTRESLPAKLTVAFADALDGTVAHIVPQLDSEVERAGTATDLFPRFLSQLYALAGDSERAVRWLTVAVDRGFINYPYLAKHDPFLARLRDDGRFREVLEVARQRWEAFET